MKALILSDSHGLVEEVEAIISRHRAEVDLVLHCGDSELPEQHQALQQAIVVRGNCDASPFPDEWSETVLGVALYATHGHKYNVKMTYVTLSYRAEEVGAHIACFGHSHVATAFKENDIIYINPGSIRLPRDRKEGTYCLCERTETETIVTFYTKDGDVVEDMIYSFPL
ncbi:metallophosphoesterase [Alkalihalobacillus oceani]|uniref:Phosphoesterase n=1 Tax=Halalkalibacter oceani TaxID=1653776 RepID=A0A9X2DQ71_9BACI|nr:metallophosphoesterase [Halalkalibacter oceani]MCM3715061.1 metallophosphoesterase [Halalkalibacter oceani]